MRSLGGLVMGSRPLSSKLVGHCWGVHRELSRFRFGFSSQGYICNARAQETDNRWAARMCCPPLSAYRLHTTVLLMALSVAEIEQVEQVANGRQVGWHVRIVIVKPRIWQIVATAVAERGIEHPVPFNELNERGMLSVDVADMTAPREGRNGDHRNARPGAEEIDGLDKAGVVVAAALVYSDEDGGLGPLPRFAFAGPI